MSQCLPTGVFERLSFSDDNIQQQIQNVLQTRDNSDYGYFIKCNSEPPAEINQDTDNLPLCPYQTQACKECFSEYMNSVVTNFKQPPNKPLT